MHRIYRTVQSLAKTGKRNTYLWISFGMALLVALFLWKNDYLLRATTIPTLLTVYDSDDNDYQSRIYDRVNNSQLVQRPKKRAGAGAKPKGKGHPEEKFESMIIKTANLTIEVIDYDNTKTQILDLIEKEKSIIMNEKEVFTNFEKRTKLTIKTPAENFQKLMNGLTSLAERVVMKNISVEDVTEEFIDVEARLKTKKELENRYSEILKKANTVKEILEVEKELNKIRSDIESLQGRMNYLSNRVLYSTIKLEYIPHDSAEYADQNPFAAAITQGWNWFNGFLIALTHLWMFILMLMALWVILLVKRYRQKIP